MLGFFYVWFFFFLFVILSFCYFFGCCFFLHNFYEKSWRNIFLLLLLLFVHIHIFSSTFSAENQKLNNSLVVVIIVAVHLWKLRAKCNDKTYLWDACTLFFEFELSCRLWLGCLMPCICIYYLDFSFSRVSPFLLLLSCDPNVIVYVGKCIFRFFLFFLIKSQRFYVFAKSNPISRSRIHFSKLTFAHIP